MTSVTSAAAMKLLDVRLKHAGSIIASTIGEFTSGCAGTQEIACLRAGGTIDLYRIVISQPSTGGGDDDDDDDDEEEATTTLLLVSRVETRSTLRCLRALRVSGSKRDVLVVGSDSGCFSVLDFEDGNDSNNSKNGAAKKEDGNNSNSNNNSNNITPRRLHAPTFG